MAAYPGKSPSVRSVSWGGGGDNFIVLVRMQRFCINDSINIFRNIDDVHRNLSQFNVDVESGGGGRRDTST